MRSLDFTSWRGLLTTFLSLALVTLIGVGARLLMMVAIQQRRERMNRQINERLRTLIAAYKTLGGSFTGDLAVDPTHLRDLRREKVAPDEVEGLDLGPAQLAGSERARRIRDAVEAALSDIILLGSETHARLAVAAARDLVEGRPIHTEGLVTALRDFIREALDLDPMPRDLAIPAQGPARPAGGAAGRDRGERGSDGGRQGGQSGGMAMGMGMGTGLGVGAGHAHDDHPDGYHP